MLGTQYPTKQLAQNKIKVSRKEFERYSQMNCQMREIAILERKLRLGDGLDSFFGQFEIVEE